jgi:hypothetical protein
MSMRYNRALLRRVGAESDGRTLADYWSNLTGCTTDDAAWQGIPCQLRHVQMVHAVVSSLARLASASDSPSGVDVESIERMACGHEQAVTQSATEA